MAVARRVYLYAIAIVALGMLVTGLSGLLEVGLEVLVERLGPALTVIGPIETRSRVSFSGALASIGLVAWLIHWWLAEGAVRRADIGPLERRSAIRKLFLYAALLIGGIVLTFKGRELVADLFAAMAGRLTIAEVVVGRIVGPISTLVATGALWLYYARVAATDRSIQPEVGAGATERRWYVYALAFIGLMLFLFGAVGLIDTLWDAASVPANISVIAGNWLPSAVGSRVASILAGLVAWSLAWTWSTGWLDRVEDPDPEARSILRKVYVYLVLAVAVAWTVWNAGRILYQILRALLLGDRLAMGWSGVWHDVGGSVAAVVVFGAAWLYHAHVVGREARAAGERRAQATIRWLYEYLVALVGAVTLAIGLGGTLSTLVDVLVQPGAVRPTNWWEDRISLFATLAIVGLPLWVAFWGRLQREAPDPLVRESLVRRIYLFLAFALSVLTLLSAGAFALYQVIRLALGELWTAGQTSELIAAASAAAVATLFLLYHLRIFREDTASAAPRAEAAPVVAVAVVHSASREAWRAFQHGIERRRPTGVDVQMWETDAATAERVLAQAAAVPRDSTGQ